MKVKKSKSDIIINILCIIMLIGTLIYLIAFWKNIPQEIPMHYNIAGEVDRWGTKKEILILPIFSWIMYFFMTVIEQFPQAWNTGVKITEENQERVYRVLKNLMVSMKLILIGIFTYLTVEAIFSLNLSTWFLPVALVITFGDIIFCIVKLNKVK